jgi:glycosyltransferase involved in cell wall biosynthesis
MPAAVLEAMSTGRAIVAADVAGCRDAVVDGENGFLVPPGAPAALAVALEQFLEDPALVVQMGRASRERAEREFDSRSVNAKVVSLLA